MTVVTILSRSIAKNHFILAETSSISGRISSRFTKRSYVAPASTRLSPNNTVVNAPSTPFTTKDELVDENEPGDSRAASYAFDKYLEKTALKAVESVTTSVAQLYAQYRERAGRTLDLVVPYEERPVESRKVPALSSSKPPHDVGDGLVMVIHVLLNPSGQIDKICACSGFVVEAHPVDISRTSPQVVITCAHTLEQIHRYIRTEDRSAQKSSSFIIASEGEFRPVTQVLSSMPRADVIALEVSSHSSSRTRRLKSLPLSPFPVYNGGPVLTHLFDASGPPAIARSEARLPHNVRVFLDRDNVEAPIPWMQEKAWRRWGVGVMLGYRSYTGIEVEAGIHSSLPHIQTSILPTPGSSGGPLICGETGAVIGMISGRRMDNRLERERGWGTSAESIFEMFSLPGFVPTSQK